MESMKREAAELEFAELVKLARAVMGMRRAQTAYFRAKGQSTPQFNAIRDRLQEARSAERAVDELVQSVLKRERVSIPGLEDAPLCPFCPPPSGAAVQCAAGSGWWKCGRCAMVFNPTTKASRKAGGKA